VVSPADGDSDVAAKIRALDTSGLVAGSKEGKRDEG
jgi:hypothetical protein